MNTEPFFADAETYISVREFLSTFSWVHYEKDKYLQDLRKAMGSLLGQELVVVENNKVKSDGVIMQPCGRSKAYLLILEVNVSSGNSDPYNRGSLAYRKYWVSRKLN